MPAGIIDISTLLATSVDVEAMTAGRLLHAANVPLLGLPAGTILYFAGTSAPTGFLKANGAVISRLVYSKLFEVIGTTFGAGDGSSTFKIPDLRGEFLRAWDDGRGVDTGRSLGTAQDGLVAAHTHTGTISSAGAHTHTGTAVSGGDHSHTIPKSITTGGDGPGYEYNAFTRSGNGPNTGVGGAHSHALSIDSDGAHTHTITIDNNVGAENRPRNIALLACIKY